MLPVQHTGCNMCVLCWQILQLLHGGSGAMGFACWGVELCLQECVMHVSSLALTCAGVIAGMFGLGRGGEDTADAGAGRAPSGERQLV